LRHQADEKRREEDEKRRQEEERRKLLFETFEFRSVIVTVERAGLLGIKKTYSHSPRTGKGEYFLEDLNGVHLAMVSIPGGKFLMGSLIDELGRSDYESPQHSVTIQPFCMGKFAVTKAEWRSVAALPKIKLDLNAEPSGCESNDHCPVERVSWEEAVEFCDRLSQKTGKYYRLPSETEWEYACRAGTIAPFSFGGMIRTNLANYRGTDLEYDGMVEPGFYGQGDRGIYREKTTDVGRFPPNAFGLYDMHGNVYEWCADHWHPNYLGSPIDGSAWIDADSSPDRVIRGGSWKMMPRDCRAASRSHYTFTKRKNDLGFRVVTLYG
jgi:formylglycine-generating enzyme required for sulfatase activity